MNIGQHNGYISISTFNAVSSSINYLIQLRDKLNLQQYNNEGTMSESDKHNDLRKAQEAILTYVNDLIGKMQVISIADIALATGYPEKLVVEILTANDMMFEDDVI